MKFYKATLDSIGDEIADNAEIEEFFTKEAAEAYLKSAWNSNAMLRIVNGKTAQREKTDILVAYRMD